MLFLFPFPGSFDEPFSSISSLSIHHMFDLWYLAS